MRMRMRTRTRTRMMIIVMLSTRKIDTAWACKKNCTYILLIILQDMGGSWEMWWLKVQQQQKY
eukprot:6375715-Ditylum_brightwellii.AAC.1